MKRVMFVLVSLFLVGTCFAQLQSGPSNTVGYVKIDVATGTQTLPSYVEFGLWAQFWDVPASNVPTYGTESRLPSDIIGTQANQGASGPADRIFRQDTGASAYRNTAGVWTGSLETGAVNMDPGHGYWYVNKSGANRSLVLAGQVNNAGNYATLNVYGPTISGTVTYTDVSWRDSRVVPRNQLNLRADGFTGGTSSGSDRVIAQEGGNSFWYRTSDNSWQGSLTGVSPGESYWIVNKLLNHNWTYNYLNNGQQVNMPDGNDSPDIQVIAAPTKTAVKATTSTK